MSVPVAEEIQSPDLSNCKHFTDKKNPKKPKKQTSKLSPPLTNLKQKEKNPQLNQNKPKKINHKQGKGILHPTLLEGASILLKEKNKPSEQLTAQVENQLENYRDKPHTFWLLYPALETHLNKSGK